MLKAIFYARFHPERGPSIIHQYPPASVVTPSSSSHVPLLNFSNISSFIIPAYELCDRPLSVCASGCRVLGFPVSLEDSKYERNRFTFNVCFVVDEDCDCKPLEQVVRKTAAFFTELEEESGILQAEERLDGLKWAGDVAYPVEDAGVVHTLLKAIMEDLNAYGETCVRLDDLHVLNLRLEQSITVPPEVRAWAVPLLIRPLPSEDEWTWDLTLQRIHAHINGIKHVQRIADMADVELNLVQKAVRELLYHERVMLLDIFHFQAIYTPTTDFAWFVKDASLQNECAKYVATDPAKNIFKPAKTAENTTPVLPTVALLIKLYRSLGPGITLHEFCLSHEADLSNIDIRRLITFGVIKGFLRRVHKYALAVDSQPSAIRQGVPNGASTKTNEDAEDTEEYDRAWKRAAFSSGWATPPVEPPPSRGSVSTVAPVDRASNEVKQRDEGEQDEKLRNSLDGKHCMDEICVAMRTTEKKVIERLHSGRYGEVIVFCK